MTDVAPPNAGLPNPGLPNAGLSGAGLFGVAVGLPGAGRARYGAAMALYQAGRIDADQLEAYRVAASDDAAHPAAVLAERGLALPGTGTEPLTDPQAGGAPHRLRCLLDESDRYLAGLAGSGIDEVRQGLAAVRGQIPAAVGAGDVANPVVAAWMAAALAAVGPGHPALAAAIAAALPDLRWITYDSYPPAEIGPTFGRAHAYATLVGAEGNYHAPDFDFGLFLIAPHVLYRDHRHPAPELYAPLTGPHGWRFGPDRPLVVRPAHQPVWNPPLRPHLTKVGPVPFLCLYGWTRDCALPAEVLPAGDWPALEALRLG